MFGPKAISMTGTLVMLSIAAATNLWAQPAPLGGMVDLPLTISATATIEGNDNGGSPIDIISAGPTQKITTQSILNLIATANSTTFPKGTLLVLDVTGDDGGGSGDVWAVDSGNPLLDVTASGNLTIAIDPDSIAVFQGKSNSSTGAASYTGAYIAVITFTDNNGNAFILTGLTKETYSISAPDKKGNQKLADSITITAVGDGTMGGANAIFSAATVTGKGSGVVNNGPTT